MYENFEWPIPPFYELPAGQEFAGHEPARVTLARGPKVTGSLTRFLPAHGVIEFLPSRGRVNLDIPLSDIVELRLTRPLVFRQRASTVGQRGAEIKQPLQQQPFTVELVNGETLSGETVAFEVQSAGLFLYLVNYKDSVLRVFIPTGSIKSQQIGRRIGEILIQEKLVTNTQVRSGLERQKALREQRLGDLLTEGRVISEEQLHVALERQRSMPMMRLGEALVSTNVITPAQLDDALELQKQNRKKMIGEILLEAGHVTEQDLFRAFAQKLGIPTVDLKKFDFDPAVANLLPASLVHELKVIPLCFDGQALVVAMDNPLNPAPIERIRFITQLAVTPVLATPENIAEHIRVYFAAQPGDRNIEDLATQLSSEAEVKLMGEDKPITESDSTLVRLVNKIILDAHASGVSDIHVETNPGRKNVRIRFRRDGVLSDYLQVAATFGSAMVSRFKIMANLDISEKRRAQDGRINFQHFGPARIELRVAIVPTLDGLEDVVLRVLAAGEPLPLDSLGLRKPVREAVHELLSKPYGLILVCGPTGSGKTTTLHSLLGVLNVPNRKIWTAEDPVEISQAGLRQVQVNSRIGWSFAAAMRSFLRADPDVVMVGEMRDAETATTAIQASLTGHLVLSTLHTNSAPETIVRLLEMGMDPFNFADSLAGVLAQRLTRKLCEKCKAANALGEQAVVDLAQEYCHDTPLRPDAVIDEWREKFGARTQLYESSGCEACKQTGYRGRMGLHELLIATPDVRQLAQRRALASELRRAAMGNGMRTLKQDGIEKCLLGLTDLAEVRAAAS
jgi:type II secretory ATPase GspE/PulE/Tfp pilus assembly ATPase PilB-like protein